MSALIYTSISVLRQAITGLDLAGKPLATSLIVGNYFAGIIGLILFIAAIILAFDGMKSFLKYRKAASAQITSADVNPIRNYNE
jgi:phage-related minor tail protein